MQQTKQNTAFGAWLDHAVRTRRDKDGAWLSQRRLAAAVGVQAPAIHKIIAGRVRPSADTVIRIANYLGEDAAKLLELAGYEPPRGELTMPMPDSPAKAEMMQLIKELLDDANASAEKQAEAIAAVIRAMRVNVNFSGGCMGRSWC